jgi:hypothetical protein
LQANSPASSIPTSSSTVGVTASELIADHVLGECHGPAGLAFAFRRMTCHGGPCSRAESSTTQGDEGTWVLRDVGASARLWLPGIAAENAINDVYRHVSLPVDR